MQVPAELLCIMGSEASMVVPSRMRHATVQRRKAGRGLTLGSKSSTKARGYHCFSQSNVEPELFAGGSFRLRSPATSCPANHVNA